VCRRGEQWGGWNQVGIDEQMDEIVKILNRENIIPYGIPEI